MRQRKMARGGEEREDERDSLSLFHPLVCHRARWSTDLEGGSGEERERWRDGARTYACVREQKRRKTVSRERGAKERDKES